MKPSQVHALDKLFSEVIRLRAKGFCEHCHKWVKDEGISPSHYYGRTRHSVRWDEDNVQGLCNYCHNILFHNNRMKYFEWLFHRLGSERLSLLADRAETFIKMDFETIKTQLQNRIQELQQ